ncbi:MAG: serine/threonine-protein kinase [Planctomycetota bacterium]
MFSQGIAVQERLGDTGDHAMPLGEKSSPRGGGLFQYASGTRPLGGYVIKRGVGSGGFGEVYYAISDAGKEVALKLIRRNLDTELRGMRQCLNLKHPNLLSLHDIRQDDSGDTWVVMEYMSGECLETELADHPQGLPLQDALVWFHGIAAGVAYLHDHGIVHRDLKPGNIFCDEGVVKVGDYGLSKFISCSRRSGHTESIGTIHYMAPEVAHGRYGKELDIYALGAILYELLTGHVPFDGESVGEVLMKHLTAQPDVSKIAEPYRSVVARALEKDPARRFATVGEMATAVGGGEQRAGGGEQRAGGATEQRFGERGTESIDGQDGRATGGHNDSDAYTDQEPIALFVALQLQKLRQRWQQSSLHPGAKRLIVAVCILLFLVTAEIVLPLTMLALIAYGGYRMIRFVYRLCFCPIPIASPTVAAFPVTVVKASRVSVSSEASIPAFVIKPLVRVTDLIGSLLVAAAVTAAMCVVMLLILGYRGVSLQIEQCAWLYLVSLAGAWFVLITAKFWEGSRGERMVRHFILMTIGLGLGLVAFGMAEVLLVRLPIDHDLANRAAAHWVPPVFYQDSRPMAMAYMAAFATLLGVLRWWQDADPLRSTRLSLWSLLVTVVFAYIIATAWQFPKPWLMMVAGCMSVSVQLSSPWVPTYARLRPQRKTTV